MATAPLDRPSLSKPSPLATPSTSVPSTPGLPTTPGFLTPGQSTPATSASSRSFATLQDNGNGKPNLKKRQSYKADNALRPDIEECRMALQLFLESRMVESEQLLKEGDPKLERLYIATGYGLIQSVKAFMSFEDKDLSAAIELTKHGAALSQKHRKPVPFTSRVTGLIVSGNPVTWFKSMTPVQRHAELVYAECLAQKAILGIVYSGDWLQFIKEAINMRACISLYKAMYAYLEAIDAESAPPSPSPSAPSSATSSNVPSSTTSPTASDPNTPLPTPNLTTPSLNNPQPTTPHSRLDEPDEDFRSGVYLGMGVTHLVLSLLPGRIVPILELFGYKGDRKTALDLLQRSGGWKKGSAEPSVSREGEGLRRSLCDMVLLLFHLVFSGFTYDGVDIDLAENVLRWNAARYPSGVFFLFGQGRLALFRAMPKEAVEFYTAGTEVVQSQFPSLQGISLWELAIAHLALWDVPSSLECWRKLRKEAGWSKCVYTYGLGACLVQLGNDGEEIPPAEGEENVVAVVEAVPGLMKKIAGKSIPMEKFAARRSKKYTAQSHRLLLPALELAYILLALPRAPRPILITKILPVVDKALAVLKQYEGNEAAYYAPSGEKVVEDDARSEKSGKGKEKEEVFNGYWDDYCLAHFLRGVVLRFIAYPDPYATVTDENPMAEAPALAKESFEFVLEHGREIVFDHHIVYHAHYELGRLEARSGNKEEAKRHIELVLSGKVLEVNWNGRKGKYNLENALNVRAHAALEGLEQGRLL